MAAKRYFDHQRQMLEPGQTIRVHQCAGRYGQMQQLEGIIESLEEPAGVRLRLTKSFVQTFRTGSTLRNPGDSFSLTLPGQLDGEDFVCDYHFVDFEHGHHAYVEILERGTS